MKEQGSTQLGGLPLSDNVRFFYRFFEWGLPSDRAIFMTDCLPTANFSNNWCKASLLLWSFPCFVPQLAVVVRIDGWVIISIEQAAKRGSQQTDTPSLTRNNFCSVVAFPYRAKEKSIVNVVPPSEKKYIEQLANLIDQSVNTPTPVFDKKKSMLREGVQKKKRVFNGQADRKGGVTPLARP